MIYGSIFVDMTVVRSITKTIIQELALREMTPYRLAKLSKVSQQTVGRVNGPYKISIEKYEMMLDVLGYKLEVVKK